MQGSGGADGPNSNKGSRQEPRHPLSKLRFSHPAPNVVTLLTAPGQTYYFKFFDEAGKNIFSMPPIPDGQEENDVLREIRAELGGVLD